MLRTGVSAWRLGPSYPVTGVSSDIWFILVFGLRAPAASSGGGGGGGGCVWGGGVCVWSRCC